MLGIITTVVRGAAKALLATTKNPTTGKTIKKVFKDPRAAKKWLQDQGATEIKTGAPKGVSARGGQTREAQFPETLTRRKGGKKVGSVPTPRRKPKKPNPKSKSSIDKYLTSPRRVGIGPSEMLGRPPIKEDKVPIIRSPTKPHVGRPKGWKPPPPNTRRDKALQRFLDDLPKSKNKGGKVINKKKKKKTGSLPITVVDRKTGKEDPYKARRMRRNTAILEQEYIPEMATPGLKSIILRLVNDAKRQFSSPERARAMRTARKVADHPRMQEKGLLGSRSKPLDAPRKHGGGMSRVGLSPAEEKHEGKTKATGTVSEATRKKNIKREAKGGGKVMKKKGGKVIYKRQGGMSRVGLSPAEEARSGTMSEAKREKYMQGGGPIHTTFPKRAHPRTEGREPEVDLFPKVERKKGGKALNKKKKQGYKDRKDESIAQRVKKKRTKKQLKASRDESYGKWGKGKGKGKIRRITSKQTDGNKLVASLYD